MDLGFSRLSLHMPQSATWDHVFWQLARAVLTWSVCPLLLLLMTREWSIQL